MSGYKLENEPVKRLARESIQRLMQLGLPDASRNLFNISRYPNEVHLSIQIGQRVPFHLVGFVQPHLTIRVTAGAAAAAAAADPMGNSLLDAATEMPLSG